MKRETVKERIARVREELLAEQRLLRALRKANDPSRRHPGRIADAALRAIWQQACTMFFQSNLSLIDVTAFLEQQIGKRPRGPLQSLYRWRKQFDLPLRPKQQQKKRTPSTYRTDTIFQGPVRMLASWSPAEINACIQRDLKQYRTDVEDMLYVVIHANEEA